MDSKVENGISVIWNALRGLIRDTFTFRDIKEIAGTAGLPVNKLSHLQQKQLPAKGASKSDLLDGVNGLIEKSSHPDNSMCLFIQEAVSKRYSITEKANAIISKFGWVIIDGKPVQSKPHVDTETILLSKEVQTALCISIKRFNDNDFAGAITSICGAVDLVTAATYDYKKLGDHKNDSYQQRVNKSFCAFETEFKADLSEIGDIGSKEVDTIFNNYRSSINQCGYVLGFFRRTISDAHGTTNCPPKFVQKAFDCGTYILRSLSPYIQNL